MVPCGSWWSWSWLSVSFLTHAKTSCRIVSHRIAVTSLFNSFTIKPVSKFVEKWSLKSLLNFKRVNNASPREALMWKLRQSGIGIVINDESQRTVTVAVFSYCCITHLLLKECETQSIFSDPQQGQSLWTPLWATPSEVHALRCP